MPTITIKFNLPEEQNEFETAINASAVKGALWDFSERLRNWNKYGHQFQSADDAVAQIRRELYRCFEDHGVSQD